MSQYRESTLGNLYREKASRLGNIGRDNLGINWRYLFRVISTIRLLVEIGMNKMVTHSALQVPDQVCPPQIELTSPSFRNETNIVTASIEYFIIAHGNRFAVDFSVLAVIRPSIAHLLNWFDSRVRIIKAKLAARGPKLP